MTVNSVSVDCLNMINLGFGLKLNVRQPGIYSQLLSDCCTASGVSCSGQRVTAINWSTKSLDGVLNGTAIPPQLNTLFLYSNSISGPIPQLWPSGMVTISMGSNLFSGNIPSVLPMNLINLELYAQRLTGPIPNNLPDSIALLDLGTNSLNGSIPAKLPNALTELYADLNLLTGPIPSNLPSGLTLLKLEGNSLSGLIPNLPATLQIVRLGLFGQTGNHFSGSLLLNKPSTLYIYDNWITDVIVNNNSSLTACDLSNNPLLGNINLIKLTICSKNGLYSPLSLPNTLLALVSSASTTNYISTTLNALVGSTSISQTLTTFTSLISTSRISTTSSTHYARSISTTFEISSTLVDSGVASKSISGPLQNVSFEHTCTLPYLQPPNFIIPEFVVSIFQVVVLMIDLFVLAAVIYFSPWKRFIKTKFGKRRKEKSTFADI